MFNIYHILKLARLEITDEEEKDIEKQFSSILDFVSKLEKLKAIGVEPMSHTVEIENIVREDKIKSKIKNQKSKILMELVPNKKDGYIKVKNVFQ